MTEIPQEHIGLPEGRAYYQIPDDMYSFLNVETEAVEFCNFLVGYTLVPVKAGEIDLSNIKVVYWGDQSAGSAYFGIGYIRALASLGWQAVLVYRPGEKPNFSPDIQGVNK